MTTFQTDTHFISISYVALILSANLSKARLINDESDSIFDSDLDLFSDDKSDSVTDSDFPNTTRWSLGGALLYSGYFRERIKMMHHEDTIVPRNFDSRKRWPKCKSIGTIWDQGQCGSCWALSSAMMMTDRTCIASNGSVKFEYSAEDLLTCCSYCVPSSKSNVCQRGGIVYDAVKYWIAEGVVSGGHVGSGRVNFRSSNKEIF
ncbi:hypothetical protein GEV33_003060 [Tenebrio molitor]|uniref:Peptidase C1A papain C-terminal domain-containing protein n=1 Tax=Tenebrio molitor TaxID=7067 RepID=A0A8J6HTN1_TENMO|nr:hypothetical protein GEV33_003060 [Tenebrio molitor]